MTSTLTRTTPMHAGPGDATDRWYHGISPDHDGGGGRLVLIYDGGPRNGGGRLVGPLPHRLVRRSPDGFAWGYGGSGPSELALNLLLDALGDQAWCPRCGGAGDEQMADREGEPYRARCEACLGSRTSPLAGPAIYQAFKFDHVAGWPSAQGWAMSRGEILAWLAPRRAQALANWRR